MSAESDTNTEVADITFSNCTLVTEAGMSKPNVGIAVTDGKISALGATSVLPPAKERIDLSSYLLAPGVIDAHVHTRSPGHEHKEDGSLRRGRLQRVASRRSSPCRIPIQPSTDPNGSKMCSTRQQPTLTSTSRHTSS